MCYLGRMPRNFLLTSFVAGLLTSCMGFASNDSHELQIVNEAPEALRITLNGDTLPPVYAHNYDTDVELRLKAVVKSGARGVWKEWVSVAGNWGSEERTPGTILDFRVDAYHRQVRATMLWDDFSKVNWRGNDDLTFRAVKGGREALLAWSARKPREVRVLDPRLVGAVQCAQSDSGNLVYYLKDHDTPLLLVGETLIELAPRLPYWYTGRAQFLSEATLYTELSGGGFNLYDAQGNRRFSDASTLEFAMSGCVFWLVERGTTWTLRLWREARPNVAELSEFETPDYPLFMAAPAAMRIVLGWRDGEGVATLQVIDSTGAIVVGRSGNYDLASTRLSPSGEALFLGRPGVIETWNLLDGSVTVSPVPELGKAFGPSGWSRKMAATSLPSSSRGLTWTRDPLWPVDDFSVETSEGEIMVTRLPWVEGAQQ